MRPSVPDFLTAAVEHLRSRLPSVSDPVLQRELSFIALGMETIAHEYDICAARRVEEITELSNLLAQGAALAPHRFPWENDLDRKACTDLKISALEGRLDVLRQYLIELQAWLETTRNDETARLLDKVFRFQYKATVARVPKAGLSPAVNSTAVS